MSCRSVQTATGGRMPSRRQASTRSSVQMTGCGRTGLSSRTWASGLLASRPSRTAAFSADRKVARTRSTVDAAISAPVPGALAGQQAEAGLQPLAGQVGEGDAADAGDEVPVDVVAVAVQGGRRRCGSACASQYRSHRATVHAPAAASSAGPSRMAWRAAMASSRVASPPRRSRALRPPTVVTCTA
jgi:hypothetical protein